MNESSLHKEAGELVTWALARAIEDYHKEFPSGLQRPDFCDADHENWHHQRADLYLKAFEITRRAWT